jgi:ABC-type transporter Mla subunit MlaD
MSKQAQVGLFTILGAIAVFAVFFVLADLGTRARGYKIGVHFKTAGGLRTAADVYLSGVPIGAVDKIRLLDDYSAEVILAIRQGYDIPVGSHFLIQSPITGEPTVLIEAPRDVSANVATLPHDVLPIEQQPTGYNPASIGDLLEQGQGEVHRLDIILAKLQEAEPRLLATLQSTVDNANDLTSNANRNLSDVTARVEQLTDSLQTNITTAGTNVADLTSRLDSVVRRDSGQVDELLTQLNVTTRKVDRTVSSIQGIAGDPKVKRDLLSTAHDFAVTAHTLAAISEDLHNVSSNPQTQAQLRDAVAQLDATTQRVDSLVGQLGGTSNVYGVDAGATPAPAPSGSAGAPAQSSGQTPAGATAAAGSSKNSTVAMNTLRQKLRSFTKDLVQIQVRVSALGPLRPGSYNRNVSPLLTSDRGPMSDFNAFILPYGHTGLEAGVNDVGTPYGTTTANFMLLNRSGGFTYGGGLEYSRLGLTASVAGRVLGFETRLYDLRHPTLDTYVNLLAFPKFQVFAGERDLTHAQRRAAFGLQFEF